MLDTQLSLTQASRITTWWQRWDAQRASTSSENAPTVTEI